MSNTSKRTASTFQEQRERIAKVLASKAKLTPVRFSDSVEGLWERDLVAARIDARLSARHYCQFVTVSQDCYRTSKDRIAEILTDSFLRNLPTSIDFARKVI